MAWDIDHITWNSVRDKILKDRYAGCCYSVDSSLSPVIIRHREPLPIKDRIKIGKLFPKWIRIEFQEIYYEGERVDLYGGRGNNTWGPLITADISKSPVFHLEGGIRIGTMGNMCMMTNEAWEDLKDSIKRGEHDE